MGAAFYGVREADGRTVIIERASDGTDSEFKRSRISPAYLHSTEGWDWGEVSTEDKARGDGRNPTKWGRVLETARHLLSRVYGDALSDVAVRLARYRAVFYYKDFATQVLEKAGDEWILMEDEIKTWLLVAEHNRKVKSTGKAKLPMPILEPTVAAAEEVAPQEPKKRGKKGVEGE